ncbi:MAG TPA: hypothetical protein VE548_08085 [Nitrososphaeraceae archaeon]|jgi:hypothetical protein|nr:hypothetical protein [Nitrososphaeraceae archaeon]
MEIDREVQISVDAGTASLMDIEKWWKQIEGNCKREKCSSWFSKYYI